MRLEMSNKIVIGVSGVAQAGKDTFYKLAEKYITEELGLKCKRYALADFLKDECRDFLRDKFNLDVYSQDITVKKKFRTLLVWFGDIKREQTQGTYFTRILEREIKEDTDIDIAIVTDIRYAEYPCDEVQWLQNHLNGFLVHVQRISEKGNLVQPPNDNEKRNDPLLQACADCRLEWQSNFNPKDPDFIDKMYKLHFDTLQGIFEDRLELRPDPAVQSAKEVALTLLEK